MTLLQDLPVELVQKIATPLNNEDLLNLSLTSKNFLVFTEYEWMKRVKGRWANGKEVFLRVCEAGAIQAAAELVTKANADPNIGLATASRNHYIPLSRELDDPERYSYPLLEADMELKSLASFCLASDSLSALHPDPTCLVKFNGMTDNESLPEAPKNDWPLLDNSVWSSFCFTTERTPDVPCFGAIIPRNIQQVNNKFAFRTPHECQMLEEMVTPLYLAINTKHLAVADLLVQSGASLNLCPSGSRRLSAFHVAVGAEGTEMAKFLIERGLYSLDEVNYAGLPPVWIAYLNQNWETVHLLCSLGASINSPLNEGFTPLVHALFNDDYEGVKKLIAAGADKDIPFGYLQAPASSRAYICPPDQDGTPLQPLHSWIKSKACIPAFAIVPNEFEEVRGFLSWLVANNEIDLDRTSPDGVPLSTMLFERRHTTLTFSRQFDDHDWKPLRDPNFWRPEILGALLSLGADPMARDTRGNSLLDLCLMDMDFASYTIVAKYIPQGKTHFAQQCSVDWIMEDFAWPHPRSAIDPSGNLWEPFVRQCLRTLMALGLATSSDITHHPDFTRLLCECLGKENQVKLALLLISLKPPASQLMATCDGKTPLQYASRIHVASLVLDLIRAGADPSHVPEDGLQTPPIILALHVPVRELRGAEHPVIMALLENGAKVHIQGPESSNAIIETINAMYPDPAAPSKQPHVNPYEYYWLQLENMLVYHPVTEASTTLQQKYVRVACDGDGHLALRLLLTYGADPDMILEDGHTPLTYLFTKLITPQQQQQQQQQHRRYYENCLYKIDQLIIFGANLNLAPNHPECLRSPKDILKDIISQATSTSQYDHLYTLFGRLFGKDNWITVQDKDIVIKTFRHAFYPEKYPIPPKKESFERDSNRGRIWVPWIWSDTDTGQRRIALWGGPCLDWKTVKPKEEEEEMARMDEKWIDEEDRVPACASYDEIKRFCGYHDVEVIAEGWGEMWDDCIARLKSQGVW